MASVPIRHTDPSQETGALQSVAREVSKILTPSEEILYISLQTNVALSLKKDAVVATSNRLIGFRPGVFGRVVFEDFLWQDVQDAKISQGMLSTEFTVSTAKGETMLVGGLDKDQAKRLYAICQQMEQEWREKRRVREMEEARAKSGGVYLGSMEGAGSAAEDPVVKLAKAKQMLDQGLISEAEYESVKAKILASM